MGMNREALLEKGAQARLQELLAETRELMQGFPSLPRRVVIEAEAFRPAQIKVQGIVPAKKKRGGQPATPASIAKRKATMMAAYGTLNVTEVKRIRKQREADAAAVAKQNGAGAIKANSGSHAV